MQWLYRLQQRLAITDRECRALAVVAALLLFGVLVRYARAHWSPVGLPEPVLLTASSSSLPRPTAADTLPVDSASTANPGEARQTADSSRGFPDRTDLPARAPEDGVRMNLNAASAGQLQRLPGIGPRISERIVAYRDAHGPFGAVDDLTRVKGIGPKTLERLRPLLFVSS